MMDGSAKDKGIDFSKLVESEKDKTLRFNLDYQITSAYISEAYSSGDLADRRERVFKGSTYALGKITG